MLIYKLRISKINYTYIFQQILIFSHINLMQKEEWTGMGQILDLYIATKLSV